jgi:uncharacterized protein HemX
LFLADALPIEQSDEETAHIRQADLENGQFMIGWPSLGKRAWLTFACFLIAVGIGVAATLAWQAQNEAAKQAIAPTAVLNAISVDIGGVRHSVDRIANDLATNQQQMARSVDQLAAQIITGQEEITHEITELRTVEQQILDLSTRPVLKPALRPSRAANAVTPAKNP